MKLSKHFALATSILLLALAVCPPPASAAVNTYLHIGGIPEEAATSSLFTACLSCVSLLWP